MSVTELSNRVGITMAQRLETLDKICEILDCQPGEILEYRKEKLIDKAVGKGE